jgi:hypothetical protein
MILAWLWRAQAPPEYVSLKDRLRQAERETAAYLGEAYEGIGRSWVSGDRVVEARERRVRSNGCTLPSEAFRAR